ncbi:cytochrome P450 [Runella sp. CRIBMP]|uniref:cytochrome P450 n=1 Tax=Runella sp. CRIBMP TaxID=2683261 RepID=UPI001412FDAA|nr:cytochrome P450 [Runella sp. CRIBMP]
MINAAIEEILRFDTYVPFTFRITTKPLWVDQYQIPAGQLLALGLSAANHDETIFSEPEKYDIS